MLLASLASWLMKDGVTFEMTLSAFMVMIPIMMMPKIKPQRWPLLCCGISLKDFIAEKTVFLSRVQIT